MAPLCEGRGRDQYRPQGTDRRIPPTDRRTTSTAPRLSLADEAWEPGEWVAADQLGRPTNPEYLTRRFREIAAAASLPPVTVKQLRHSHATALLAAGENPKIVQERLGHASIQTKLDIYSAVLPNMQRQAIDRLAAFMESGGR